MGRDKRGLHAGSQARNSLGQFAPKNKVFYIPPNTEVYYISSGSDDEVPALGMNRGKGEASTLLKKKGPMRSVKGLVSSAKAGKSILKAGASVGVNKKGRMSDAKAGNGGGSGGVNKKGPVPDPKASKGEASGRFKKKGPVSCAKGGEWALSSSSKKKVRQASCTVATGEARCAKTYNKAPVPKYSPSPEASDDSYCSSYAFFTYESEEEDSSMDDLKPIFKKAKSECFGVVNDGVHILSHEMKFGLENALRTMKNDIKKKFRKK